MTVPVLRVRDLTVGPIGAPPLVEGIDLDVGPGEILGLVGESGSGKTTTALALLGFARSGLAITHGVIEIDEHAILDAKGDVLAGVRGRLISYVPQDPGGALDPSLRVQGHIGELIRLHCASGSDGLVGDVLNRVGLPSTSEFQRRFPHQLSGGQQQRLAIAMAIVAKPRLIVLDEPTTGLDVITQATVLKEIRRLRAETGAAMVYVSHDLAIIASIADRLAVMYAGVIVETGPTQEVIARPRHPYTRGLLLAAPDHRAPKSLEGIPGVAPSATARPRGCLFAPRCPQRPSRAEIERPALQAVAPGYLVRCFDWLKTPPPTRKVQPKDSRGAMGEVLMTVERLSIRHSTWQGEVVAAHEVSFDVRKHQVVALVGQSGSGKTSIARAIAGLQPWQGGRVLFKGTEIAAPAACRSRDLRRRIQFISQNATESLNPRLSIQTQVTWPARLLLGLRRREAASRTAQLLERVRLPASSARKFPAELSGGERQRAAIARALAAGPELLVCDEITSALDVSVQAVVLGLLDELRREFGLSLLFIAHDLGVVASIADQVLVLEGGQSREYGPIADVLRAPSHVYTKALIEAVPSL